MIRVYETGAETPVDHTNARALFAGVLSIYTAY